MVHHRRVFGERARENCLKGGRRLRDSTDKAASLATHWIVTLANEGTAVQTYIHNCTGNSKRMGDRKIQTTIATSRMLLIYNLNTRARESYVGRTLEDRARVLDQALCIHFNHSALVSVSVIVIVSVIVSGRTGSRRMTVVRHPGSKEN